MARILRRTDRPEQGLESCRKAVTLYDRAGDVGGAVAARRELADFFADREDRRRATRVLKEALGLVEEVRRSPWARRVEAEVRERLGEMAAGGGDPAEAVRFWSMARTLQAKLDRGRHADRLDRRIRKATAGPADADAPEPGREDSWPRTEHEATWEGDPPDPELPPVELVARRPGLREEYRGAGVPLAEHPGIHGAALPDACLGCGSHDTVCAHLTFSETPHVDKTWEYALHCSACGAWSRYRCWA